VSNADAFTVLVISYLFSDLSGTVMEEKKESGLFTVAWILNCAELVSVSIVNIVYGCVNTHMFHDVIVQCYWHGYR